MREPARLALHTTLLAFCLMPLAVCAQPYPSKPIRLVIPFGAGGNTDVVGRIVGQKVSEAIGQQILIDNRPGAGGNIATELVARSAPDGYTLLMGTIGTQSVNAALYPKLAFDPAKDFAPITLVTVTPHVVFVHPSVPARSMRELVALATTKPGTLNFASAGNGSSQHLGLENFHIATGGKMTHIPYKSGAEAATSVISGQVSVMFEALPVILQHIKSGKVRALAVAGPKRLAALPDLPSVNETGVPQFTSGSWQGVLAPAGTPADVIARLNAEFVKVVKSSGMRDTFVGMGAEAGGNTPEEFEIFIRSETAKWSKIVKSSGMRID